MRSRIKTSSSRPAPYPSKVPKACRPSTRILKPPPRYVYIWSSADLHWDKLADFLCFRQSRSGAQTQDLLTPDLDLRSRDRELTEIAKSIASLAELFKDLSALVIDQGTLLDSVEYNIEQTAVQMSDAVKELDIATRCVSS